MRILIVDDSKSVRKIIAGVIQDAGHDIDFAISGEEAVDAYKKDKPDLVLMDVEMPGMGGYEAARKMREYDLELGNGEKNIEHWVPIIFLSGRVDDTSIAAGLDCGGDDYLVKPTSKIVLTSKINAMQRISEMRKDLIKTTKELAVLNHKLYATNEILESLSLKDPLTKIANRRHFEDSAKKESLLAIRHDTPIAVCMIDVDNFKKYNDHFGHQMGDECLIKVANTLNEHVKRPADVIARYGGEEFVALLPETKLEGAVMLAEELRKAVESLQIPHAPEATHKVVTASIGIACSKKVAVKGIKGIMEEADKALYVSKEQGRNRVTTAHIDDE